MTLASQEPEVSVAVISLSPLASAKRPSIRKRTRAWSSGACVRTSATFRWTLPGAGSSGRPAGVAVAPLASSLSRVAASEWLSAPAAAARSASLPFPRCAGSCAATSGSWPVPRMTNHAAAPTTASAAPAARSVRCEFIDRPSRELQRAASSSLLSVAAARRDPSRPSLEVLLPILLEDAEVDLRPPPRPGCVELLDRLRFAVVAGGAARPHRLRERRRAAGILRRRVHRDDDRLGPVAA